MWAQAKKNSGYQNVARAIMDRLRSRSLRVCRALLRSVSAIRQSLVRVSRMAGTPPGVDILVGS